MGSSSSAGALRGGGTGGGGDDSDEDETPSTGQRIGFAEGAISMDQVRVLCRILSHENRADTVVCAFLRL